MPYIVNTSLYPSEKAVEVGKIYLEAMKKYPLDESLGRAVVPTAAKTTLQGIKVMGIIKVKKGKLEDTMTWSANIMGMFRDVQGFESSTDVYMTIDEGYASIGVSMT